MDQIDRDIINGLHGGLAICERPYLDAAQRLGLSEDELLSRLARLLKDGVLTRVGPLYQIERMGGAFTLAALHAPAEEFEQVAQRVNALPQVAHNYERDHDLNMWFVIATETPAEIEEVIHTIERETGCSVFNFPKSREYFVELKLKA
ncbi:Lrp/AsnC family transcriptional regulator [Rhodoferax ferrireducens]|uniref:Lrp/AsnC family transcriptional regulator n=1 Tax=Rhodoferax ferrireducens TaxID=192843 RepID=UPI000E0CD43B|nr:AsnC family transcriptional regulator [Rhodoferax ferrireducens]